MTTAALIEFRRSWQGPHDERYFGELERLTAMDDGPADDAPDLVAAA